jgi:type III pantothenate kinase
MLLAVDIGNTNTVAGVFDGDRLVTLWRVATVPHRMADEYAAMGRSLFRLDGLRRESLDGVIVASVVPDAQAALSDAIRRYLGLEPMLVSVQLDLGIAVHHEPPTGVGADRLANAVAAVRRYGAPAIVVDFGTGTNFDIVDGNGNYTGGAIAPGLEISVAALRANTAQLPSVPLVAPERAIGRTTINALQSGIIFGYAGLVDGLVERIRRELGAQATVIATGGLAPIVAPHSRTIQTTDLDLTLFGLALIYRNNVAARAPARAR